MWVRKAPDRKLTVSISPVPYFPSTTPLFRSTHAAARSTVRLTLNASRTASAPSRLVPFFTYTGIDSEGSLNPDPRSSRLLTSRSTLLSRVTVSRKCRHTRRIQSRPL